MVFNHSTHENDKKHLFSLDFFDFACYAFLCIKKSKIGFESIHPNQTTIYSGFLLPFNAKSDLDTVQY